MVVFLFHSKEAGLIRSKDMPKVPEQDHARTSLVDQKSSPKELELGQA